MYDRFLLNTQEEVEKCLYKMLQYEISNHRGNAVQRLHNGRVWIEKRELKNGDSMDIPLDEDPRKYKILRLLIFDDNGIVPTRKMLRNQCDYVLKTISLEHLFMSDSFEIGLCKFKIQSRGSNKIVFDITTKIQRKYHGKIMKVQRTMIRRTPNNVRY